MPLASTVNAFFRNRADALTAAEEAALKEVGGRARKMARGQLRSAFRKRAGNASTKFFKAKGGKPTTLYLSIKPSFLRVFEEGATVRGSPYLVIPIPPFKRVGKRGWNARFNELKARAKVAIIPVNDGYLVTANGRPAYKLQPAVNIQKRLDITNQAAAIADTHGDIMEKLLSAKID